MKKLAVFASALAIAIPFGCAPVEKETTVIEKETPVIEKETTIVNPPDKSNP